MAKDPAFLWYSNDFSSGTQFFTDDQVGKYVRLLMAQHQHGHLPEEDMIIICKSYDPKIFSKFIKDSEGLWYNKRLEIEIDKRKNYSASRSKNKKGKIISSTYDSHMENENENRNENELKGVKKEDEIFTDDDKLKLYHEWTEQIIDGNDPLFAVMFNNEGIPQGDHIQFWILDHRDLLNRYPKMRPGSQQQFRSSLLKHIRENHKKPLSNGKSIISKKQQQNEAARDYLKKYYGGSSQ